MDRFIRQMISDQIKRIGIYILLTGLLFFYEVDFLFAVTGKEAIKTDFRTGLGKKSESVPLIAEEPEFNSGPDSISSMATLLQVHSDSTTKIYTEQNPASDSTDKIFEPLPILSYDTDTGFGFGAKAFFLNYLSLRESFDIIIFFSTKGEKWFRMVFSMLDFEMRQGKLYPLAIDLIADYDKWIAYNYFGVGNQSRFEDKETYYRQLVEFSGIFSRGFSEIFVGQVGIKYKQIKSWNFDPEGQLDHLPPETNLPFIEFASLYFNIRYDSRDSYIHPSKGIVFQTDIEWIPDIGLNTLNFYQWSTWIHYYTPVLFKETIFAGRIGLANIRGNQLPFQVLFPIGGNRTLRGYPQDRFLDKTAGVINLEYRFPIYWRLGGLVGADLGRVWPTLNKISLRDWHNNITMGLRFYMETFVVRIDVGISAETMGIYFNFGHIF